MKKSEKIKRKVTDFLFDHRILKTSLEYVQSLIFAFLGAAIFAFGFCCFITPADPNGFTVITGGVSGLSQVIALLARLLFNYQNENNLIQSVGYFVINIPLLLFAFFKISKKFAIFTTINVALTSLFISLFTQANICVEVMQHVGEFDGILARVLMAALCTGASSAICFRGDISCGGIDIVSYYIGMRKSSSIGKYGVAINTGIIVSYALLMIVEKNTFSDSVLSIFYSVIYLFICGLVIDYINLRNKKVQLQIITDSDKMTNVLLAQFPHGATITHATGAYTHNDRLVIWMVVSINEVNKVIKVAKKVDQHVFISSIPINQVYGNFYNKPIA